MRLSKSVWYMGINLAYIVVTVVLIFRDVGDLRGTYKSLNGGLERSIQFIDEYNELVRKEIFKRADSYKSPMTLKYKNNYIVADSLVNRFCEFIDSISLKLERELGIDINNRELESLYSRRSNELKHLLFTSKNKLGTSIGAQIEFRVKILLERLKHLVDNDQMTRDYIPLDLKDHSTGRPRKNWREDVFKEASIYNIESLLLRLKIEAKSSNSVVANYINNRLGGDCICFDQYKIAIAPENLTVLKNGIFKAKLYLAAYSSSHANCLIKANEIELETKYGVAKYQYTPKRLGTQTVNLSASFPNQFNDTLHQINSSYKYEVLERAIVVNNQYSDVLYSEIENTLFVKGQGVNPEHTKVRFENNEDGSIKRISSTEYRIKLKPSTRTYRNIKINSGDLSILKQFRVLPIPAPQARLNSLKAGIVNLEELKLQDRLEVIPSDNFKEVKCTIDKFTLKRIRPGKGIESVINQGPNINSKGRNLLNTMEINDIICIDNIIAKGPIGNKERLLNSLVFTFK